MRNKIENRKSEVIGSGCRPARFFLHRVSCLFPVIAALSCASGSKIIKNAQEGTLCVSVPVLMTSRESEFIPRDKDSLSEVIGKCVKARLDGLGFSWVRSTEDLDDRIMRSFKPLLKDDDDPVDSISYAVTDLAGAQKTKRLAVIYLYLNADHTAAMYSASILSITGQGIWGHTAASSMMNSEDDLYIYCSLYDIRTGKSLFSKRVSFSDRGKSDMTHFKEEVGRFIDAIFR